MPSKKKKQGWSSLAAASQTLQRGSPRWLGSSYQSSKNQSYPICQWWRGPSWPQEDCSLGELGAPRPPSILLPSPALSTPAKRAWEIYLIKMAVESLRVSIPLASETFSSSIKEARRESSWFTLPVLCLPPSGSPHLMAAGFHLDLHPLCSGDQPWTGTSALPSSPSCSPRSLAMTRT